LPETVAGALKVVFPLNVVVPLNVASFRNVAAPVNVASVAIVAFLLNVAGPEIVIIDGRFAPVADAKVATPDTVSPGRARDVFTLRLPITYKGFEAGSWSAAITSGPSLAVSA
jgi:hypothetical protein